MKRPRHTLLCALLAGALLGPMAAAQDAVDPEGMWAQATLYRDEWGVPHVYAETPRALGFAFGYAQAEDHLAPMLIAYRIAKGRAAEVLGEACAASDELAIRLAHARLAEEALNTIDPLTAELCVGFARGVNAWMVEHQDRVPAWAEGVQPPDILALWHAYLTSMAPFDLNEGYRPPRPSVTGNAWALAPDRTASGESVLVINPHQYYGGPFRWYEAHLVWDGLNAAGATLFGLPVIVQGHNGLLGWALTPNESDSADVFIERDEPPRRNPKDPRGSTKPPRNNMLLLYMSQARPYYVNTPGGMEERHVPSLLTESGPIVEDDAGGLHAWHIGGYNQFGGLRQLLEMARCRSLGEFRDTLLIHQLPCFHVVYADAESNIFYLYNTRTGNRDIISRKAEEEAIRWDQPQDAGLAAAAWFEIIPPDALPSILNPPSGYLQACGNPPWFATEAAAFTPGDLPPWLVYDRDTYRAKRLRQWLTAGTRHFEDHEAMLFDTALPAAAELVPAMLQMMDAQGDFVRGMHPDVPVGLDLLRAWDYSAATDTKAFVFYRVWWAALTAQMAEHAKPDLDPYAFVLAKSPQAHMAVADAAAEAARTLRNELDAVEMPWGEAHRIIRGTRDEPCPGAMVGEPIFVSGDAAFNGQRWESDYGYGYAMVVDFTTPPRATSIVPFGTSEVPESPHFSDQLDLFLEGKLKKAHFLDEDVWRAARSARGARVTLYPRGVQGAVTIVADAPVEASLDVVFEAPGPLPEGLAPFTLYVQPKRNPTTVPMRCHIDFRVPPVLCGDADLAALALYAHEPGLGWYLLREQHTDPATRFLSATADTPAAYAILGPKAVLIPLQQPPIDRPAEPTPSDTPETLPVAPFTTAVTPATGAPNTTPQDQQVYLVLKQEGGAHSPRRFTNIKPKNGARPGEVYRPVEKKEDNNTAPAPAVPPKKETRHFTNIKR